jgi:hypothetical protein
VRGGDHGRAGGGVVTDKKLLTLWVGLLIGWIIGSSWVDFQHTRRIRALEVKWSSLQMDGAGWLATSWKKGNDYTVVVCTGDSIRVYDWKDYGQPRKAIKP